MLDCFLYSLLLPFPPCPSSLSGPFYPSLLLTSFAITYIHSLTLFLSPPLSLPLPLSLSLSLSLSVPLSLLPFKGKSCLLKCLLSVRSLLNSSEPYYILNNLYVTDYCGWIQSTSHNSISSLSAELEKVRERKERVREREERRKR